MEWLKYLNNQDHMPGKSLKRKSGGTGTDDPDLISGKRPRWECEPGFKSTVKPLILVDELIGNPPPALLVRGQHLIQAKQVKDEEGRPDKPEPQPDKPVPEPVCADEEREKLRDRKASDDDEDVGGGADDDDDDDEDDDESVVPDMDVSSRDKSDTSSSQMSSTETSSRETSSAMTSSSDSK